jgi:S1-C subfamily serine protease
MVSAHTCVAALASAAVAGVAVTAGMYGTGIVRAPWDAPPAQVVALTASARATLRSEPAVLARDAAKRRAEMITLRVRNISCAYDAMGSAFALDRHTLITNRHVIAGAAVLQVDTWDGVSIRGSVDSAVTGRLVDVGMVKVRAALPAVAKTGPAPRAGARVTAVGYPLAGPLTLSPGRVIGYVDGRRLDPSIAFDGRVIEVSSVLHHGNSGGPLLDARGRVVGIVYAGRMGPHANERSAAEVGYAIPLREVHSLMHEGGTRSVAPCEG